MKDHTSKYRLRSNHALLIIVILLMGALSPVIAQIQPTAATTPFPTPASAPFLTPGPAPSPVAISAPLTGEAADRVAIRELIDAYAHDADRRETDKQTALFTADAILENNHTEPGKEKETTILQGRKDLRAGFATLKNFEVTMHFNGQSTIQIHGDTATGETYCLAHHIFTENGQRILMILGLRYNDTMVRVNGAWLFAKRQINYDWVNRRPLHP